MMMVAAGSRLTSWAQRPERSSLLYHPWLEVFGQPWRSHQVAMSQMSVANAQATQYYFIKAFLVPGARPFTQMQYAIVEFSGEDLVELVPVSWIGTCANGHLKQAMCQMIKKACDPEKDWKEYKVDLKGLFVGSLGAEKENTDPEEGTSSSDLGPLSSMGSSCVADGRPWGVDCRDGSPGLFGPEVRGGRPRPGGAFPCSEVDASEPASTLGLGPGATGTAPVGLGGDFNESRRSSGDVWVPVDAVTGRAGPLRTTSAYPPFDKKIVSLLLRMDTRLREAGVEAVYCLARGAPKGPNIPRAQLNHQGPLFPGHGYATHSQTWVGEPTWLGVRSDATHQAPTKVGAPCVRVWWPTWLGSVVTLLTKHLAPKVQAPPAGLGVRGDATLQTPAFTGTALDEVEQPPSVSCEQPPEICSPQPHRRTSGTEGVTAASKHIPH
ncbi:hypothetical protein ISCGN_011219 [Ixodes scapularis]